MQSAHAPEQLAELEFAYEILERHELWIRRDLLDHPGRHFAERLKRTHGAMFQLADAML